MKKIFQNNETEKRYNEKIKKKKNKKNFKR